MTGGPYLRSEPEARSGWSACVARDAASRTPSTEEWSVTWSAALDLALGLTLVFLVSSVAASRLNEFVASRRQWRARGLERALDTMLGGHSVGATSIGTGQDGEPPRATEGRAHRAGDAVLSAGTVKAHPIVASFESALGKGRRISYLPSRAFSATVLDILAPPAVAILDSIPDADLMDAASRSALSDLRAHPDADHVSVFEQALPAGS